MEPLHLACVCVGGGSAAVDRHLYTSLFLIRILIDK
jgi:hypothetical protein